MQCFEKNTLLRFRKEFGWEGRLMMIFGAAKPGADGSNYDELAKPSGLRGLAGFVDGVFPNVDRVIIWESSGKPKATDFANNARDSGLWICSGVIRQDSLPAGCPTVDALHAALFDTAGVNAVCSDFPDLTVRWVREHQGR